MKRFLLTLMMITSVLYGFGQHYPVEELLQWRQALAEQQGTVMQNLSITTLREKTVNWWDGTRIMELLDLSDNPNELSQFNLWAGGVVNTVQIQGMIGVVKDTNLTLSLHQTNDKMLLVIKENGRIFDIFMEVQNEQPVWEFIDLHDVLDGVYMTPDSTKYMFGLQEMFEGLDRHTADPGIFSLTREKRDDAANWNYIIEYGEGRVSHGYYVEDPAKRDMPGAGGAGAIMGPMIWGFNITEEGLQGKVLRDEPTVDHNPAITEEFTLKKVQTPFKGVDGRWPFASLRPLNRQMLLPFPKEILRLMRNEIYARHGVKFKSDEEIQAYFDRQPWYKASDKPSKLTGLEKLNVSLIKSMEDQIAQFEEKTPNNQQ